MFLLLSPLLMISIASADLARVNLCDGAAGCCGTGFLLTIFTFHIIVFLLIYLSTLSSFFAVNIILEFMFVATWIGLCLQLICVCRLLINILIRDAYPWCEW